MKIARDKLGIPVLDGEDVEQLAARFLEHLAPKALIEPVFTPIADIMRRLQQDKLCTFSFDEDLGSTPEGYKYLGYFHIKRKHIGIDVSLSTEDVRFPFTVAHELGHFYLHSKVKPQALKTAPFEIRDSTRDLVTHRIDATKSRTLLEWQANKFAAGILMPRATVRNCVIDLQKARGITRNLGTVWLDRSAPSNREHSILLQQLAAAYRVSRSVARYRLRELDILHFDKASLPTMANETLGTVLADLFGLH
jgi:Zn-dependent peptidase ImmA (M78 family)